MTNTNITRPEVLAAAKAAAARSIYATLRVRLPDGTEGACSARAVIFAARTETQDVAVRQGRRADLWWPSQLRLA